MKFVKDHYFHIYNQGNDRQRIFFNKQNYEFFLWKIRSHVFPFGDLISFCLMPNHFHLLIYVRAVELDYTDYRNHQDTIENRRRKFEYGSKAMPVQPYQNKNHKPTMTLNDSIGDMQKGYAMAINNAFNRSGSLFRSKCKAKTDFINEFVTVDSRSEHFGLDTHYARICLNYIHDNPVKARLVKIPEDYKWSSAQDYAGLRNGSLCNVELGKRILDSF